MFPDYNAYKTPEFFQSDWLNEFLDERGWESGKQCDDYRFVYIGPKGSWYMELHQLYSAKAGDWVSQYNYLE